MLLNFFKKALPQVFIIIVIFTLLLWLRTFISNEAFEYYFDSIRMPFYDIIAKWFPDGLMKSKLFVYGAMLTTAFLISNLNSKHIVIKQRTFLPALFFMLLASCYIPLQRLNPSVFSALIMVFAIDHIFAIYHKENVLDNLFKAGFLIAIASLFYAPAIFYMVAVFLSISSIRTFNIREWFAPIIGLFTPWFFFFFYHYFVNSDLTVIFRILSNNLFTEINHGYLGPLFYTFYGYILILFISTGVFLLNSLQAQKISVRKYYGVFFWFNLVTVALLIFIPSCSIEIFYIASIPMAFQFSHYFTLTTRKFWPSLFFNLFIILAILLQFYKG